MSEPTSAKAVQIDYINHRGERSIRWVEPIAFWFGGVTRHPEPQWLMEAFDLGKQENRTFAMKGICSWKKPNTP